MKNIFIGSIIGGFIVWMISTLSLTAEYGRLSNHKDCDMSVESIKTLSQVEQNYHLN